MASATATASTADVVNALARQLKHDYYRPLYLAALKGDWESANRFFEQDPLAVNAKISILSRTALHIAAIEGQSIFLEKLVVLMSIEAISLPDSECCTALHHAAIDGSIRAVKALVRKNPALVQSMASNGFTPLLFAIISANGQKTASPHKIAESKEVIWFLSLVTTDAHPSCPFSGPTGGLLILLLNFLGFYDITLYLLHKYPYLATAKLEEGNNILVPLALKPSAFPSGSRLGFLGSCIYPFMKMEPSYTPPLALRRHAVESPEISVNLEGMPTSIRKNTSADQVLHWFKTLLWKAIELLAPCVKQAREARRTHQLSVELVKFVCRQISCKDYEQIKDDLHLQNVLGVATACGTVEIVRICYEFFPDLIWVSSIGGNIAQIAIEHRQEKIFSLIYEMNGRNKMLHGNVTKSLHLAAKLAPSSRLLSIPGSAFQMQREMQWFKEVEKLVHPVHKLTKENGKTAWEVFTEQHKELVEKAEKWTKDTSNSCMVVSTLIATVVFAAAFTVPGGNRCDTGIPVFLWENSFMVFAISDVVALFSSVTSLMMFLSILTSRYTEEDFHRSLPKKLIIGLASLFFAIASMMIAFGATLSIVLEERLKWVSIPITLLASFPVIMFGTLQLPLFIQMVKSTYGYSIFQPEKLW